MSPAKWPRVRHRRRNKTAEKLDYLAKVLRRRRCHLVLRRPSSPGLSRCCLCVGAWRPQSPSLAISPRGDNPRGRKSLPQIERVGTDGRTRTTTRRRKLGEVKGRKGRDGRTGNGGLWETIKGRLVLILPFSDLEIRQWGEDIRSRRRRNGRRVPYGRFILGRNERYSVYHISLHNG